jgi:excisionase family DNA binding protein
MLTDDYAQLHMKDASPQYLTSEQLAEWLHVSLRTVVNLRRRRVLPHIKIGRVVRFSRVQVEAALQAYTIHGIQGSTRV